MEEDSQFGVECGDSVCLRVFFGAYWGQCTFFGIHSPCGHLCFIRKMPSVQIMVLRVLMWDCAFLKSCSLGINDVVLSALLGVGTVM